MTLSLWGGANQLQYNQGDFKVEEVVDANTFKFYLQWGINPASPATGAVTVRKGNDFAGVVTNNANTLYFSHGTLGPTYDLAFSAGDTFQLWKVDESMDQPCSGQGTNLGGGFDAAVPAGWNNQVVEGCYEWNNTREGGADVDFAGSSFQLALGEHFFNDTPMPGYTPFVYPHPLVSGSPTPPPPPPTPTPPPPTPTPPPPTPTPPPPGPDTTPPVISNISASNITSSSATITWTTDEVSDTQVEYGFSAGVYPFITFINSSLTTAHSQPLSSLSANTTYHYRVRSRDAVGNLSISANNTFATPATGAPPPPPTPPPPTPPPPPPGTPPPPPGTPPPSPTPASPFVKLKLINHNGTYYLIINNIRHGITNPGLLTSYGFTFAMGKTATAADLSLPEGELLAPSDGILAKTPTDKTVWLISNKQRLGFTSATVFTTLGFSFIQVLVITEPELNKLPRGNNLDDPNQRHQDGVDINLQGTIYWISGNTLYPYPSLEVYNSWRIPNDFSRVLPANAADAALPKGGVVIVRVLE